VTRISGRQLPRRHRQASPPVRCDAGVQCAIVGWNALTHRFEVMSDLPSPVDEAEFSSQEISHAARPAVVWQSRNVARLFGRDAKQGHTSETETKTKFSRPRMIDANILLRDRPRAKVWFPGRLETIVSELKPNGNV